MPSLVAHLKEIKTLFENNINGKCSSSSWEQPSSNLSLYFSRLVFNRLMMFFVSIGTRYGLDEEEDPVSGGEFTSGRIGVHGKARHFFTFINLIIVL
ncbi:hypothetical protein VNO77_30151 [Canavalia gladiata]|uniref:Uncharacterized protein n=1 Tax=Canavalia gladiata TaxID=3824 RepID=A0AAN9KMP8_CANGL